MWGCLWGLPIRAARLLTETRHGDHIPSGLVNIHRLPAHFQAKFKPYITWDQSIWRIGFRPPLTCNFEISHRGLALGPSAIYGKGDGVWRQGLFSCGTHFSNSLPRDHLAWSLFSFQLPVESLVLCPGLLACVNYFYAGVLFCCAMLWTYFSIFTVIFFLSVNL